MYKFLLANRYLRTRFIALASIISVTLGVATMIVVNAVMSGFSSQMKDRIHGILSDLMVESTSMDGTDNPQLLIDEVERIAGQHIAAITPTMEIYGMMSFEWVGQTIYRPVTLIGIVPDGKDAVSPLKQYLVSRKELIQNGKLIRPPLRSPDEPLDWSLSEEAVKTRADWIQWREFDQLQYDQYGSNTHGGTRRLPETVEQAAGSAPQAAELSDPFPIQLAAGVEPISESAVPMSDNGFPDLSDPFSNVSEPQSDDPASALSGRVFVGAGLVSFPHQNPETEETEIISMAHPGEDVNFTTISAGIPEPVSFKATIVDVFQSGMSEYDSNLVFCNLEELQRVRGMMSAPHPNSPHAGQTWREGAITTLQIKLKDYASAEEVVRLLQTQLQDRMRFQVRTWEQKQGPLLEAVAVESAILNVLLFLIITVAGFGILAIFYMIVIEKTRDIGILKALGASSRGVMFIFLSYGLSLGIVGSGGGVVLGLLFVHYINEIEDMLSAITGHKVFDEAIYYFQEIPTVVYPSTVICVALGAMVIAVLASVLPARRAAQLHPVQALRYE